VFVVFLTKKKKKKKTTKKHKKKKKKQQKQRRGADFLSGDQGDQNARKDSTWFDAEEYFYQLKGTSSAGPRGRKIVDNSSGGRTNFFIPPNVPHAKVVAGHARLVVVERAALLAK